ncbi:DUF4249 domain-containing protein [Aestuariivivens insulae]|uniref:DUF4249 family protein n=1 Tax=Aestuariivivens insulae TaxID=1621988 RepID=UPI001F56EC11|nr:DUF4249 family protein [Aestuariivivens insulae]
MKTLYKLLILLPFLAGCTKEIDLQIDFESQIFILGAIGNEPDNVTIEIQETVPVQETTVKPIRNATISLYTKTPKGDKSLVTNSFKESKGVYTSTEIISPTIGNYYWVEIKIPNNNTTFKSQEEQMKPVVPISSINKNGTSLAINFEDPRNDTNLYFVELSYFQGDNFLHSTFELSNDTLFNGNKNAFIQVQGISGNKVKATLSNLNYRSFLFYSNLYQQEFENSDDGSGDPGRLFSTPPVNLTGNITNMSTKRPALGNFAVVSLSTYEFSF